MVKRRREALRMGGTEKKTERNSTNPFLDGWAPEITYTNKRLDLSKRPELVAAGLPADANVSVPTTRDSARFIKVFEAAYERMDQLSNTGHRTLQFVFRKARINNGMVHLPVEEAMDVMGFKQTKSFYDGITELILLEFLARTEKQGLYYLNQELVFNGSRRNIKNTPPKPKA